MLFAWSFRMCCTSLYCTLICCTECISLQCHMSDYEHRAYFCNALFIQNLLILPCLDLWRKTQRELLTYTNYIDFYNILKYNTFDIYDRKHKIVKHFGKALLGQNCHLTAQCVEVTGISMSLEKHHPNLRN